MPRPLFGYIAGAAETNLSHDGLGKGEVSRDMAMLGLISLEELDPSRH